MPGWSRSSRVIFPALTCGRRCYFCDVNRTLVGVDVSSHSDVVSFMAPEGLRIVDVPRSLVGYKCQYLAVCSNCPHNDCEPVSCDLVRAGHGIGSVLRNGDEACGKAQRENCQ